MNVDIEQRLLAGIEDLNPHGGKARPSPHKPLMLLWAVRRRGVRPESTRLFPYAVVEQPMRVLLAAAGSTTTPRPWYPYVRLRSSDLWEFCGDVPLNSSGDVVSVRALKESGAVAGFRSEFDPILLDAQRASSVEEWITSRWLDPSVAGPVMASLNDLSWEQ